MGTSCGKENQSEKKNTDEEKNNLGNIDMHKNDNNKKYPLSKSNNSEKELTEMRQLYPVLHETDELCTKIHRLYLSLDIIFELIKKSMYAKNVKDEESYSLLINKTLKLIKDFNTTEISSALDELRKIQNTIAIQTDPIVKLILDPISSKLTDLNDIFLFKKFISSTLSTLLSNDNHLSTKPEFISEINTLQFTIKKINNSNKDIIKKIREIYDV